MSEQNRIATIERRQFVAQVLAGVPDALVVSGLGSPSYDVFAAGDRDANFYLWGAMGGAAALGLGLAIAQPQKPVVVITGDGEQLMGIGALGTIGAKQPKNLSIVVLDNGHYGETGMQQSHSSLGTDLVAVSKGFGIANSFAVWNEADYGQVVEHVNARKAPTLVQVHIRADEPPRALPPRDGVFVKNRFRAHLGFQPF
ncbi:Phosphonopyruvate decarboxylase [Paraburkholderia unamae]|uniref:thiamine pyrophosphate-dependent enzyme n=1 Tax=Paraburkholderia unamae TaxID=219649 RepID=UPI001CAEC61A|nr:thiamine pyrophosphate-dependent enzyme [Paraburkholderia unamae]CAG9272454.1 Phosphonopyruvate decarboxylase [Paraburkholderia unamae]